ncbi:unnamed protein product, partial [Ilex paraguariensis]
MAADPTQFQLAQLAAVLGHDATQFEVLITTLMSTSNDQRSQAESLFNLCKQTHPDTLSLKLCHVLSSSPNPESRAMSAVLLRKLLTPNNTNDNSFLFPSLSPQTQLTLKSSLLNSIVTQTAKSINKKLCDTVSELAASLLPENQWPDFLPFLFQCVTSDNMKNRESALLIFAQLAQYIGETLNLPLENLHSVLLQCLGTGMDSDVRIAALGAAINFIQCLEGRVLDKFRDLLPLMMSTLTEALNCGNEAAASEALELLIELAGTEPRFLRRQIVEVVGTMLQIAGAESLEEGTRHLAIEFVVTLAEARERAPGMVRKMPQFVRKLFEILMKMLEDIEDDPKWHNADNEDDEDAGETGNYGFGQECLDRLSISLGGNSILPVASEVVPVYLAAPEWQKHHAALIALAQIAEGCSKVMITNLEQVVSMVLNSFQDPHPRVRWAAVNAIGQLSTDLGPDLQVQYHHRVLPALAAAMDDFQNPRVQAHAASAILNFSENCTADILLPYLDGTVAKLLVLLQNGKQMVQEGALTALASVADSSQDHFQKYYDAVMPYLKAILVNATDKTNRMLRAKAMECISLVGMAVGKDKFRDDAKQV